MRNYHIYFPDIKGKTSKGDKDKLISIMSAKYIEMFDITNKYLQDVTKIRGKIVTLLSNKYHENIILMKFTTKI